MKRINSFMGIDNQNVNQDPQQSSAEALKSSFSLKNTAINWQQSEELMKIYSSIRPRPNKPDFSGIKSILDNLREKKAPLPLSEAVGVIVETRKDPHLESVIINFIQQTGLKVQLFYGRDNLEHILSSKLASYLASRQLILTNIQTSKLTASQYNSLLLSKEFWMAMVGREKIFIFQTDSWICSNSGYLLNDFLEFDYIGSAWPRKRPIGLVIDGGSGGLSLRDWGKSVECLDLFPAWRWEGGEDAYFAFHVELIGGKIGRNDDCVKFSTQYFFPCRSYAAHKIVLLPKNQQKEFIEYCPEAAFLLNR